MSNKPKQYVKPPIGPRQPHPPTVPPPAATIRHGWRRTHYQSGTTNVPTITDFRRGFVTTGHALRPWLWVGYAVNTADHDAGRQGKANAIAAFLNGQAPRPAFLESFDRPAADWLVLPDGTKLVAVGPMIDRDPPNLNWVPMETPAANAARADLIDILAGVE